MLRTRRIASLLFVVRDIDQTEMFYRETLGLRVQRIKGARGAADRLFAPELDGVSLQFLQGESMPGNSPILIVDLNEDEPHHPTRDSDVLMRTGRLISHGCTPAEIQWLLGISAAALRQRVEALSRVRPADTSSPAIASLPGTMRSHLLAAVRRIPSTHLGSHDQDGHLFLIRLSQSGTRRQLMSGR